MATVSPGFTATVTIRPGIGAPTSRASPITAFGRRCTFASRLLSATDTLRGVLFTDFGTVESNVSIDNFRVAPGFGFRITLPAMGPAPIALDFAFPVVYAPYDNRQIFSFFVGFAR